MATEGGASDAGSEVGGANGRDASSTSIGCSSTSPPPPPAPARFVETDAAVDDETGTAAFVAVVVWAAKADSKRSKSPRPKAVADSAPSDEAAVCAPAATSSPPEPPPPPPLAHKPNKTVLSQTREL